MGECGVVPSSLIFHTYRTLRVMWGSVWIFHTFHWHHHSSTQAQLTVWVHTAPSGVDIFEHEPFLPFRSGDVIWTGSVDIKKILDGTEKHLETKVGVCVCVRESVCV